MSDHDYSGGAAWHKVGGDAQYTWSVDTGNCWSTHDGDPMPGAGVTFGLLTCSGGHWTFTVVVDTEWGSLLATYQRALVGDPLCPQGTYVLASAPPAPTDCSAGMHIWCDFPSSLTVYESEGTCPTTTTTTTTTTTPEE